MGNPYREHMDQIQALVKQIAREQMFSTRPEPHFADDDGYALNWVAVSGGEGFDTALEEQLEDLMKTLTGEPDPEIVAPPPTGEVSDAPEPLVETEEEDGPIEEEELEDEPSAENL